MNVNHRRALRNFIRIVLYCALALVIEWGGWLERVERVLYDLRTNFCQRTDTPPTDRIVHIDIDDTALDQIGRWPWDRAQIAEMVDEIGLAGTKVIAFDILFGDPSPVAYDKKGNPINSDALLAGAVKRSGRVLLPTSLSFEDPISKSPLAANLFAILSDNPELTYEQCAERLKVPANQRIAFTDEFIAARPEAMRSRIEREMKAAPSDIAAMKRRLLPHSDPEFPGPLDRIFEKEFNRAAQDLALLNFTMPSPPGIPDALEGFQAITPILPLSNAARYGGFVDYLPEKVDGAVRFVPLFVRYRGRLIPHMGLVLACAALDVDVRDVKLGADHLTVSRPGKSDINIPVSVREDWRLGEVGMIMQIPMFGKKDGWLTMYDYPRHEIPAQHLSMYEVWRVRQTYHKLQANEIAVDHVLASTLALSDPDAAKAYEAAPKTGADKAKFVDETLAGLTELIAGLSAADLDEPTKKLLANCKTNERLLRQAVKQDSLFRQQLDTLRAELRKKLQDRAALVGHTGTGHVDIVPTSLDARCPGVVLHGAIANAIISGNMWRVAPRWVTYCMIVVVSVLTGVLVSLVSPRQGFMAMAAVVLSYLAINGFVLFRSDNLIVGASEPVLAAMLVWAGITVPNFITEIAERNRITRRFSNYVDPTLVNYVIAHPEKARIDGDAREMTMGFTDLAGFTTLTESLGPRTVPLLSEYMDRVIPCIRANGGYVSRLMGDGIYFFFNAPGLDSDHAAHAVGTVLDMHAAVEEMNRTLPKRNYPTLKMRAGLCTGQVVVGDFGSKEFSDYTAVGNAVNTAARFESANKVFGTQTMASERTIELLKEQFLFRPLGNLRVVGRTEGINVFEPLARTEAATDRQRLLAELSTMLVASFQKGDFAACLQAAESLDGMFGPAKFAEFYRSLALQFQIARPPDFNGQVVLTEK